MSLLLAKDIFILAKTLIHVCSKLQYVNIQLFNKLPTTAEK